MRLVLLLMQLVRKVATRTVLALPFLLCLALQARAEWVSGSIEVGGLPRAIGMNPVTNKVYVAQEDSAQVFVYEPLTGTAGRVPVGIAPNAIAVNPLTNRIYVANQQSASLSVIDGEADIVVATVPVGVHPYAVVVNPQTNRVYVVNRVSDSISVIDGNANTVAQTIPVGDDPRSLAVNPLTNKIYVANRAAGTVTVIDGATGTTIPPIAVGSLPNSITVNPSTNKIYVANQGSANVTRIDGATLGKKTISGVGSQPYTIAVDPVLNKIFTANVAASSVTIIDGGGDVVLTTVAVGPQPVGLAVNAATSRIYVCNLGGTNLTVVNGPDHSIQGVNIGGTSGLAAAVNAWTGKVYVARNVGTGIGLIEVDATTNTVASVLVGPGQSDVAVNRKRHRAYIVSEPNDAIIELDLNSLISGPVIGVGDSPFDIVIDELRDKIYVANLGSNTVSVIDGPTRSVTNVPVGVAPRALAFDDRGNRLFVANFGSGTVTVVDGATLGTSTVPVEAGPWALAYDPVAKECYVANMLDDSVTRIDAGTLATERILVGNSPSAIAIDPETHRIFVALEREASVKVISGLRAQVECTILVTGVPGALAVDPVRGQVFVADSSGTIITVVQENGWTRRVVHMLPKPYAMSLNQKSGRLYVGFLDSPNLAILDLNHLGSTTVSVPSEVRAMAVDDHLGRAVAALGLGGSAAIVTEAPIAGLPLTTTIDPLPSDEAAELQDFSGSATSTRSPNNAGISRVFVVLDSPAKRWVSTSVMGQGSPSATWTIENFGSGHPGTHEFWSAALDQTSATVDNSSQSATSVFAGKPSGYLYSAPSSFTRPPSSPPVVMNVEVDWLVADGHSHEPQSCVLEAVRSAFYRNGILLRFERSDAIVESADLEVLDMLGADPFDSPGEWTSIETSYRDHEPGTGWHYMLFGHDILTSAGTGNTGIGEIPGDEFIVAMGPRPGSVGTPWDQTGTFMHELGHNLGLGHGGRPGVESVEGSQKPNYPSVMCYRYTLTGVKNALECQGLASLPTGLEELDYSHGSLSLLDEDFLSEADGLGFGGVDWDCSGGIGGVVARDVSTEYDYCDGGPDRSGIADHDDWGNLCDITSSSEALLSSKIVSMCPSREADPALRGCSCTQPDPCLLVTGVPEEALETLAFLGVPFPNPFGEWVTFTLAIQTRQVVELSIFDISGRHIVTLVNQSVEPGRYSYTWNGRNTDREPVGSGVYFGRLVTGGRREVRKVLCLR